MFITNPNVALKFYGWKGGNGCPGRAKGVGMKRLVLCNMFVQFSCKLELVLGCVEALF